MGAPHPRGAALIDVVVAAGLMAVLSSIAIPAWQATRQQSAARAGARFVATRLQHLRVEALRRNTTVALRVDPDLDRLGVYADGDGDGVLEADITSGVDALVERESRLSDYSSVSFRIWTDVPEPETGTTLPANSDPLRIGRSSLVSFSPLGSATSGTLYLAGPRGPQLAVRIFGATGRIRVLQFDATSGRWRED